MNCDFEGLGFLGYRKDMEMINYCMDLTESTFLGVDLTNLQLIYS